MGGCKENGHQFDYFKVKISVKQLFDFAYDKNFACLSVTLGKFYCLLFTLGKCHCLSFTLSKACCLFIIYSG